MKIGYFSPMPPQPTGVADYSAALLPYLRALGEVELNVAGDANLYHIGNNHLHREIYQQALARPGTIVLHDAVLHHFMLGTLDRDSYIAEFVYNYGEWSRGMAEELWRDRARSGTDPRYFAHPMLKRITEASRTVIVHNPAAAALVRAHAAAVRIVEIPHLFRQPELPSASSTERLRTELDVRPETLLLATFGHQRETKRLHVVLRAFEQALAKGADVRLLVSGGFVSETYERSVAPLLARPGILRTGFLSEPDLWRYAAATDACLNLRYPTAAETSGVAISMMGIGKPVIFTAGAEIARIPGDACLRLEVGPMEEVVLAEYIAWMAANRDAAREIGRRAAAHIASQHAPEKVARAYWDAIELMYKG